MAITADNASNNNSFLKKLERICKEKQIDFNHKKNNIRCLAHIINLTVQEILRCIKLKIFILFYLFFYNYFIFQIILINCKLACLKKNICIIAVH